MSWRGIAAGISIGLSIGARAVAVDPVFQWLAPAEGVPGSCAMGISRDGSTVVGFAATFGFAWTSAAGMQLLPVSQTCPPGIGNDGTAWAVSTDGAIIVGEQCAVACRWVRQVNGTYVLQTLPAEGFDLTCVGGNRASGLSADGLVAVGETSMAVNGFTSAHEAVRWAPGMADLNGAAFTACPNIGGAAYGVSDDGLTIVGRIPYQANGGAFRWRSGTGVQFLGTGQLSFARGASADGNVVVGDALNGGTSAFRWRQGAAVQNLSMGPGVTGGTAYSVSDDGKVVVGTSAYNVGANQAVMWTATGQQVKLVDLLAECYGVTVDGYLLTALSVSGDGRVITGQGLHNNMGDSFIIRLPPTRPKGDANGDRLVDGFDLSTLLSQFGHNVAVGTGADFNSDGVVNGFDLSVLLTNFGHVC